MTWKEPGRRKRESKGGSRRVEQEKLQRRVQQYQESSRSAGCRGLQATQTADGARCESDARQWR